MQANVIEAILSLHPVLQVVLNRFDFGTLILSRAIAEA